MSIVSEAANRHIESLLKEAYPLNGTYRKEYRFCERLWRMDFAVPHLLCAIELDGGNFVHGGHTRGAFLDKWHEKHNEATKRGWKIFYYSPGQIIKAGRKRGG